MREKRILDGRLVRRLVITFVVLIAWRQGIVDAWFERPAYDMGVRLAPGTPSDKIAIIAIDEQSLENIGRWPWSRDIHANMIEILEQGGAKAIGSVVFFTEPQLDPGLESLAYIGDYYAETDLYSVATGEIDILNLAIEEVLLASADQDSEALKEAVASLKEFVDQAALTQTVPDEVEELASLFVQEAESLNTDQILAASMESAGNVVLAMPLITGRS